MAGDVCEAWLSAGWSHSATLSPCPPLLVSPATPPAPGQTRPSCSSSLHLPKGTGDRGHFAGSEAAPRPPGSWPPESRARLSERQSDSVIHWLKATLTARSKTHSPPRPTRLRVPLTPPTPSPPTASRSLPFPLPGRLPLLPRLIRHPSRFYLHGLPSRTVGLAPSPVTCVGPVYRGAQYLFFDRTKAKTLRSLRFWGHEEQTVPPPRPWGGEEPRQTCPRGSPQHPKLWPPECGTFFPARL